MGAKWRSVVAAVLAPMPALAQQGGDRDTRAAPQPIALLWWVVVIAVVIALLVLLIYGRSRGARR
jgi:hypothetical protein